MKRYSKNPKGTDPYKILRLLSREEQLERNGGGQFVQTHKVHKDKSKYDRKEKKKGMRDIMNGLSSLSSFYFNSMSETSNFLSLDSGFVRMKMNFPPSHSFTGLPV